MSAGHRGGAQQFDGLNVSLSCLCLFPSIIISLALSLSSCHSVNLCFLFLFLQCTHTYTPTHSADSPLCSMYLWVKFQRFESMSVTQAMTDGSNYQFALWFLTVDGFETFPIWDSWHCSTCTWCKVTTKKKKKHKTLRCCLIKQEEVGLSSLHPTHTYRGQVWGQC